MPRIRLGSTQLGILEYLNSVKGFDSIDNVKLFIKTKRSLIPEIQSLKKNGLVQTKTISGVKSVKITQKGIKVYQTRTKPIKFPIIRIDIEKNYYANRFRSPGNFTMIRIAQSGSKSKFLNRIGSKANSISKGSQVKMGMTPQKKWKVQSVRIRLDIPFDKEQDLAIRIFNEIEKIL